MGGCLAAVFALALHNLVDFNLEVGGVALPFVVVLGIVSASRFSHAGVPLPAETRLRLPGKLAIALVPACILAGAGCVTYAWTHQLDRKTEALIAEAVPGGSEPCSETPLGKASCEMLRHHPADYIAPLAVGKAYLEKRPRNLPRAVYWLSRAVYLNPGSAVIRRLTGRALYLAGREEQALMEYRLGVECDPASLAPTVSEVLRLTGDPDAAIRAVPNKPGIRLQLARILHGLGNKKAAAKAARLALELDSSLIGALDLLGAIELSLGNPDEALRLALRTIELYPRHDNAYYLKGRAYFSMGDKEKGEESWASGLDQAPGSMKLAHRLGDLYLSQGRIREAENVVARLKDYAPTDSSSQASLNSLIARLYEAKGMLFEAGRAYRTAATLAPSSAYYIFSVGRIEQQMGNWDAAERIFERLLRDKFNPKEMNARIEAIRTARQKERNQAMWRAWIADKKQGHTNER
jgi:tetratricopeptide (TPR) repeat protein